MVTMEKCEILKAEMWLYALKRLCAVVNGFHAWDNKENKMLA